MPNTSRIQTPEVLQRVFRDYEDLSISLKIEKLMFFYFSVMMTLGALVWGIICVFYGHVTPAYIPFGYVGFSIFNFVMCSQMRDNRIGCTLQVFTSILLPFVFQFALGGLINSGFVMLWSVLALLGSMTFQGKREVAIWVIMFTTLCAFTFYKESSASYNVGTGLPVLLTALNVLAVSVTIFGLAHYFIRMQKNLQEVTSRQKKELRATQLSIDEDLKMAEELQAILQSNVDSSEAFSNEWVYSTSQNHVNGNFHWKGDFLTKHIVVFVENPHGGIRGSMEAMMLWNMIENSVSRAEVQAPHNLIEFIQRDLYSKYDFPQIRESMKEVKMTVLCRDSLKNEVAYASIGSTLLVSEGDNVKVLCGFNRENGEVVTAPNGVKINIGRFMPYPAAKLLFVNDAILETFDIKDDYALSSKENKLNGIFEWGFDIAKSELQKEVEKASEKKDLFLLALQV